MANPGCITIGTRIALAFLFCCLPTGARHKLIGLIAEENDDFYTVTWQSNDEAGMWVTALPFSSFDSSLLIPECHIPKFDCFPSHRLMHHGASADRNIEAVGLCLGALATPHKGAPCSCRA